LEVWTKSALFQAIRSTICFSHQAPPHGILKLKFRYRFRELSGS